ncbi:hypothetical protein H0H93_012304, partial [Arthromyces matolae]
NALDQLWELQWTLGPLVKVMPPDLWTFTEPNGNNPVVIEKKPTQTFTRPLTEIDFVRFDYYASKIRSLHFSGNSIANDVEIHEDVLHAFALYRPSRVYLPNIQTFEFGKHLVPRHLRYYPCLLNNSIDAVTMDLEKADALEACALVSVMSRICPKIEYLRLSNVSFQPAMAINDLVVHLSCLDSLGVHSLPTLASVQHLGTLSTLSTWKIEGYMDDIPGPSSSPDGFQEMGFTTENGRFAALTTLGILSKDWDYPHFIMKGMQCTFKSLTFVIYSDLLLPDDDEIVAACTRLCESISLHACRTTLTHLDLHDALYFPEHVDRIECLFKLTALEKVRLSITNASAIDDAWLLQASASWPCLQTLTIAWLTRTTLLGLAPLIRGCPNLVGLHVCARWDPFDLHLLGDDYPRNLAIDHISTWAAPINNNVEQ